MKRVTGIMACAALALMTAGPLAAQDKPQEKPKETTIVVKDDATPKVKKGARVVSDASINSAVKTRLMGDKAARGSSIDVDTKDGVVTITGAVPTAADKARIGSLVSRTTGVKSVTNNLSVSPAGAGATGKDETKLVIKDDATPKVKAAAKKTTDAVKNTKVEVKDDTKVVVKDDATPKVKAAAKKTGDAVKDTKVVVKDDTTPQVKKAGAAVSDTSVNTAVKTRLMSDEVARGTSIDVSTKNGVVTIAGAVPTAADKTRIGDLVSKTTGVKTVVNNLTVK